MPDQVRPDQVGQAMVDRAHLQVRRLQRPEGGLDPREGLNILVSMVVGNIRK